MTCPGAFLWSTLVVGVGFLLAAPPAFAALIAMPEGAFSGSERIAQFETAGTVPYSENGATFELYDTEEDFIPTSVSRGHLTFSAPNLPPSLVSTPTLRVTFAVPVHRVGFMANNLAGWGAYLTVVGEGFEDAAGLMSAGQATSSFTAGYPPKFFGFESSRPMSRIDLTFSSGLGTSYLIVDDFRFEPGITVPEVSLLAMLVVGAAGVARRLGHSRR